MIRIKKELGHEIPGGHSYPIPGGPVVNGESIKDLLFAIREYRINNGLPPGDPLDEVTAYYAKKYPWSVEEGKRDADSLHDSFSEEVVAWINRYWKSPPKQWMPVEDTQRRQSCCLSCPYRVDEPSGTPADAEALRRAFLLSKGSLLDEELGCCTFHKWNNRLACLMTMPEITRNSPKCCWCFHSPQTDSLDKSK